MKVTHAANFNRVESIDPLQCGDGCKKSPAYGAFRLSIGLGRELFPYRGGAVADLLNRFLKFFLRHLQMLDPILDLMGVMHVDLRAIVLALVFQALQFLLLMKSKPASRNQAPLLAKRFRAWKANKAL
jgi:hypothetical protein